MEFGVIGPDGDVRHVVPLKTLEKMTFMHDMAITKQYTLILDLPLVMDPENVMKGRPVIEWQPTTAPSRIGAMPRFGSEAEIRWFDVEPGFVFHTVNAYEEGDVIVLHGCRSSGMQLSPADVYGENWPEKLWEPNSMYHTFLHEWRLDLATGAVTERALSTSELWLDFPVINPHFLGRANTFAYCVNVNRLESKEAGVVPAGLSNSWVKYNVQDNSYETHDLGGARWGGEASFVPRGDMTAAEDDGWLVAFVFDEASDSSELVIVDCKNFAGPPVCRIALPQRVPFGFHGLWVDGQA